MWARLLDLFLGFSKESETPSLNSLHAGEFASSFVVCLFFFSKLTFSKISFRNQQKKLADRVKGANLDIRTKIF